MSAATSGDVIERAAIDFSCCRRRRYLLHY